MDGSAPSGPTHSASGEGLWKVCATFWYTSCMATPLKQHLDQARRLGFEEVLKEAFSSDDGVAESYHVFFKVDEGLLLTAESYRGDGLNSSNLYFNARRYFGTPRAFPSGASGGMVVQQGRNVRKAPLDRKSVV